MAFNPQPYQFRVDHLSQKGRAYMLDFLKSWLTWATSEAPERLEGMFKASDGICVAALRWDESMTLRGSSKQMHLASNAIATELVAQQRAELLDSSNFPFTHTGEKSYYNESRANRCPYNEKRRAWVRAYIAALEAQA